MNNLPVQGPSQGSSLPATSLPLMLIELSFTRLQGALLMDVLAAPLRLASITVSLPSAAGDSVSAGAAAAAVTDGVLDTAAAVASQAAVAAAAASGFQQPSAEAAAAALRRALCDRAADVMQGLCPPFRPDEPLRLALQIAPAAPPALSLSPNAACCVPSGACAMSRNLFSFMQYRPLVGSLRCAGLRTLSAAKHFFNAVAPQEAATANSGRHCACGRHICQLECPSKRSVASRLGVQGDRRQQRWQQHAWQRRHKERQRRWQWLAGTSGSRRRECFLPWLARGHTGELLICHHLLISAVHRTLTYELWCHNPMPGHLQRKGNPLHLVEMHLRPVAPCDRAAAAASWAPPSEALQGGNLRPRCPRCARRPRWPATAA